MIHFLDRSGKLKDLFDVEYIRHTIEDMTKSVLIDFDPEFNDPFDSKEYTHYVFDQTTKNLGSYKYT